MFNLLHCIMNKSAAWKAPLQSIHAIMENTIMFCACIYLCQYQVQQAVISLYY